MIKKVKCKVARRQVDTIVVPSPSEDYEVMLATILNRVVGKITKAKQNGETQCYISHNENGLPREIIQKLIDAGYDIRFSYFDRANDWFIKACWFEGCDGHIYNEHQHGLIGAGIITIDEMFSLYKG